MRLILTSLLLFLLPLITLCQKVQFKKDKISVDKQERFEFLKLSGEILGGINHFTLKDLNGNDFIQFTDTVLNYEQLPNETSPRKGYKTHLMYLPSLERSEMFPVPIAFSFRKYFVKELEEIGFFATNELNNELVDKLMRRQNTAVFKEWAEDIDTTNTNRLKNYSMTEEKIGGLQERKPGSVKVENLVIKDGQTRIGKFVEASKGSYSKTFEVVNDAGYTIGKATIVFNDNRINIRTLEQKLKVIYFQRTSEGKQPSEAYKLYKAANYLVNQGYL